MRVVWMAGLAMCLAVQGCAPPPGGYYGAPPGYAPQPYIAGPGSAVQPPTDSDPGYADPGYAQPGYAPEVAPGPGYYAPPPVYGYAPPPVLPPFGLFRGRDRFDRERFERERFDRGRFDRGRQGFDRGIERSRFRDGPPQGQRPQQQAAPAALQGPARPQDFRRPPEGGGRRGMTPEQLRQLR